MANADTTLSEAAAPYPHPAYAWYVIGVLFLAYVFAFVDRQIMAFMVGPIRADLGLTDFQFSLVHGLAFVIFYSLLGIPIARLADAHSRRAIIAGGVGLWSLMTALCGLTGSFWQLFLARLGVGVGEASLAPSAISLISDYFPKEKRTLAINVYSSGLHGGAGLAFIFGGVVVGFTLGGGAQQIPLLGELRPWQVAFLLVGLPGLLVSALALTIKEPLRRERRSAAAAPSLRATLGRLSANPLTYATLIVGGALCAMASYGTFSWVPATYERTYGWGPGRIGLSFGVITVFAGAAGLILSGLLVGRLTRAGRPAPHAKIMLASMAAAAPPAALLMAVDSPYWTLGCLSMMVFFLSTPIGLVQSALQAITPNDMRAQVIAVYILTTAFIGMGLCPSSVAALTDYYFHDDAAVGASIAIMGTIAASLGALVFGFGVRAFERMAAADATAGTFPAPGAAPQRG